MGLFNFIKNAGEKLFGKDKKAKESSPEVTKTNSQKEHDEDLKVASRLKETIHDLNLKVSNLNITIDGELATVSGLAYDQSNKEKIVLVVGNVDGIAQVQDNLEVENKEPESVFHTVERGDTLSKIAKEHYGNANKYHTIFEANKPMLSDPDKIYPGQVLRIPALDK